VRGGCAGRGAYARPARTTSSQRAVTGVRSWSATARHVARTGRDPVPGLRDVLAAAWPGGDPRTPVTARWLLVVRAGRA
jgi:hypothetical protein